MKIVQHNWCAVRSGGKRQPVAYECGSNGTRRDYTCRGCGARVDSELVAKSEHSLIYFWSIDNAYYNNSRGPFIEMVMEANDSPA